MGTVTESPNRKLRREMGWGAAPSTGRICVGDWMKLRCGNTVREHGGRHEGRVEAIFHSHIVVVKWHESGWLEYCNLRDLERVR